MTQQLKGHAVDSRNNMNNSPKHAEQKNPEPIQYVSISINSQISKLISSDRKQTRGFLVFEGEEVSAKCLKSTYEEDINDLYLGAQVVTWEFSLVKSHQPVHLNRLDSLCLNYTSIKLI